MKPQQGIMSLAKPKQRVSARDSRAVDQVLDNTTQMLGKLDKKTLGLLLQLTQYIKANKPKYKELMANLEAKGSLPPGVFPSEYDPKFLSVFALSVAKAQQAKNGMAAGGIAGIAQTMKDQGRGKDTMLAHISPEEAELLEKRGGVGTTNPVTGLPEYGIFDDIGNALSGVGNAVGSVLKPVGDLIGGVLSSPLGMAATAAAAYYFMGPGAGAVVPSVAEAALPGAIATEAATTALTPAAIESGIGSAGYGYNASAAASGLFDPATIGSGAAIGAPSTNKLLAANLLKNVNSSPDEEESQSGYDNIIQMLMMYELMNKQNQPNNTPLPGLTESASSLPYDSPKKQTSAFISQPVQRAAEGGLMTKNLGIGGLSARRSQTDYAKNYLPGSGYRPGQGGITYFTPMEYIGGGNTSTGKDSTPSSSTDELLEQTLGRTGGGGQSQEQRDQREADLDRMDDYLGMTMRDYWNLSESERADVDAAAAEKNPIRGNILKAVKELGYPMILRVIDALKNTKDTVQQTWADNTLRSLGIDPNIVLANQNEIAGLSMQQALNSLGQDTTPSFTERSPEQMAGISMQRALDSLGQNTAPITAAAEPNKIAGSDMQRALDSLAPKAPEVAPPVDYSTRLYNDLSNKPESSFPPGVAYTDKAFTRDAFGRLISPDGPYTGGATTSSNTALTQQNAIAGSDFQRALDSILSSASISEAPLADQYEGVVSAEDLGSQFPGPAATNTDATEAETRALSLANQTDDEAFKSFFGYYPDASLSDIAKQANPMSLDPAQKAYIASKLIENNPVLSEQEERVQKLLNQTDDEAFKSFYGYEPDTLHEAPPETENERLNQIIQSFIDTKPGDVFGPESLQLASADGFNLGEDGTDTTGKYSMLAPSPLASLAPTPYSYTGGPSLTSIANSYGNQGSTWTNGEGNPWVGADGKFLLTGQGAAQNAFNESPAGKEAAMRAEVQSLQNRYPAPSRSDDGPTGRLGRDAGANAAPPGGPPSGGGGRSSDGGGFSGSGAAAGSSTGPAPGTSDGSNKGWGSRDAGGGDARGGYLQHGRFDQRMADGGIANLYNLGSYSDGGRLLKGPGDGVSDDIPATIGRGQPARLADGEFVIPARIVSELGNGSTDAGARKLYAMMDRIQKVRRKTKNVAANTKAAKYLPA